MKRRQVLGMTQQQLAGAVGVSKSTVANWESGKHFPLRYLGKVEAVLGVSLADDDAPRRRLTRRSRRDLRDDLSPEDFVRVMELLGEPLDD